MCGKQNKLKHSKRETMTAYLFIYSSIIFGFSVFCIDSSDMGACNFISKL